MRFASWIFGSRQSGGKRRTELVTSSTPDLSYTGGLYSGRMIRVEPDWLSRGSMPEVIFHLA